MRFPEYSGLEPQGVFSDQAKSAFCAFPVLLAMSPRHWMTSPGLNDVLLFPFPSDVQTDTNEKLPASVLKVPPFIGVALGPDPLADTLLTPTVSRMQITSKVAITFLVFIFSPF